MVNAVKDGDARPWRTIPAKRCSRPFEISVVESLGRARPVVELKSLEKMSNSVTYQFLKKHTAGEPRVFLSIASMSLS
jgi:hypothetical protein